MRSPEPVSAQRPPRSSGTSAVAAHPENRVPHAPEVADSGAAPARLHAAFDLLATVLQRPTAHAAADALVTELANRHDCERVSLGWVTRGHAHLHAQSHVTRFDRRSDLAQGLVRSMEECVDQEQTVLYVPPGESEDAPLILRKHAELARLSGSTCVCSIPLQDQDRIYGVLTLQRDTAAPFDEATITDCTVALQLTGPYLHLKWRDQRWIGSKAADSCTRFYHDFLRPGRDGRKIAAVCLLIAALFVCFGKGQHRVPARAFLQGSTQRASVAPFDGYIGTAPARPGDLVKAGTLLCSLDRRELELELQRWGSEQEQLSKRKQRALAHGDASELRVISAQLGQNEARRSLVEFHLSQTDVTSPIDGVVVSGDLSQAIGSPIARGDVLFQIAPLDEYRVLLEVDERDIGDIAEKQAGSLVLSAFPGERLSFQIDTITPVSVAKEGRNYFQVEASLRAASIAHLRPGMDGIAKVDAGERRHLWIWTHDLVDWLRVKLWTWLP